MMRLHGACRCCDNRGPDGCRGVTAEQFIGNPPCFDAVRNRQGLLDGDGNEIGAAIGNPVAEVAR
jgi:hypothetical protein